jgi:Enoyl-CoA hydratase/carnithine racemase
MAETIAARSLRALYAATAALDAAAETTLGAGLRLERQLFAGLFGGADQREGMAAFRERRAPEFNATPAVPSGERMRSQR